MRWKIIGLIVFAIIIAGFTLVNDQVVTVHFVFFTAATKLVLVILFSILLGMVFMAFLWSLYAWRLRGTIGNLKAEVRRLESAKDTTEATELEAEEPSDPEIEPEDAHSGSEKSEF